MRKNAKIILILIFLFGASAVLAQESHDIEIEEGRKLVESKISCDKLSNEQLEVIGEYYMEQMHPGKAHEVMDNMMGGEGSESLKQVHINMARRLYCNDNIYIGYGMMGSGDMMGMMMNMMGGGMMGNYPANYSYGYNSFIGILWLIFLIGVIALIIWVIYKLTRKGKEPENPMGILKKRFARGEITKRQFDDIKKEIEG